MSKSPPSCSRWTCAQRQEVVKRALVVCGIPSAAVSLYGEASDKAHTRNKHM